MAGSPSVEGRVVFTSVRADGYRTVTLFDAARGEAWHLSLEGPAPNAVLEWLQTQHGQVRLTVEALP